MRKRQGAYMIADSKRNEESILQPGRNAWRICVSDRLAFLVDGVEYFSALDATLRMARSSIRIVGWDFDPEIRLRPQDGSEPLGELLRALVEERPELTVDILVWSMGPLYSGHSLKLYTQHAWADHPRIRLRFDTRHALRGSHHQKLVTVDEQTAFVGGIDLTAGRWDTADHVVDNPLRVKPNGDPYGPVHDVQALLSGEAARSVSDLVRKRWLAATGEELPASPPEGVPLWPPDVEPAIRGCSIAVVRTTPNLRGLNERREASRLTCRAIAAARRHVYIETQYFASFQVGREIEARLRQPDGPEIVVIVTCESRGLLEQFVMAHNRNRLIRRLKRADRWDRLRVMFAVVPGGEAGGEKEVLVHSKVLVVDDAFVRVGSSNLNNRSEGLDTECDLAVEAASDEERSAIAAFRDRLLAEHLDVSAESVSTAIRKTGSMVEAIERLNVRPRGLRPFPIDPETGRVTPLPGTGLLDPVEPFSPLRAARYGVSYALSRIGSLLF